MQRYSVQIDSSKTNSTFSQRQLVAILLALGYLGAVLFYGHLLGASDFPFLCPVCPHIDSSGTLLGKLLRRSLVLGTLNAGLFLVIGLSTARLFVVLRHAIRRDE